MYPYRVFISYSHSDRHLVERLVHVLNAAGVTPMWDEHLLAGVGFSKQIQKFIINSHIFIPFLTAASADRPWLHQEIGFAAALGKPIVPVTLVGPPPGMISEVQAIQLRDDLADAADRLHAKYFDQLMDDPRIRDGPATYECTDDNTQRAQLLADYGDSVSALGRHGQVRQMASLTTFHLPDRESMDPVWKSYFPGSPGAHPQFKALRQERVALVKHARELGCQLILDPAERLEHVYRVHPGSVRHRINGLLAFLRTDSIQKVVVAVNKDSERNRSLTIVGDWFSSEAVSSGVANNLREAVFTRHAPTVLQQIEDFDNRLRDSLADRGWTAEASRARAISYLQAYLDQKPDRGF